MLGSSPQLVDIILPLENSEKKDAWTGALAKKLKCNRDQIGEMRLRKHSIDARKKDIKVRLRLEVVAKDTTWSADPLPGQTTLLYHQTPLRLLSWEPGPPVFSQP